MNTFESEYPRNYLIGIRLFEAGDYFIAHEVWEDLWQETAGPKREFFQGLIQVAVGLCHFFNGNGHGARALYGRALGHLQPFRPRHLGLDLERFLAELEQCFAPVLGQPVTMPPFRPELVPFFHLVPLPARWPDPAEWEDWHERSEA